MSVVDQIQHEHRVIEWVVNCLEKLSEPETTWTAETQQAILEATGFLLTYGDSHLSWENRWVFRALAAEAKLSRDISLLRLTYLGDSALIESRNLRKRVLTDFQNHAEIREEIQTLITHLRERFVSEDLRLLPYIKRLLDQGETLYSEWFSSNDRRDDKSRTSGEVIARQLGARLGIPQPELDTDDFIAIN